MDFIKGLSFSLLLAYDKEKDESFWNSSAKLKEIGKIKSISQNLSEYLLCEEEKEIDLENISDIISMQNKMGFRLY